MIRVFHLIKALGRGGAEVLLAEGLAVANRGRFEFSYGYLQNRPDELVAELESQGTRVHCFQLDGNLTMLLGAKAIARHLRESRIDLLHAHLPMAGIVARVAGRLAGVPVVYTEHGPPEQYHWAVRLLNRVSWPWQAAAVAISDHIFAGMKARSRGDVLVRRIPNGVDTRKFDPSTCPRQTVRMNLGITEDAPVVGTVANFRSSGEKRLDLWLSAAKAIRKAEPSCHFLLVGDGPLRSSLESSVGALGLADAVRFVGHQSDVRPFLAAMDVFLMTSAYEGLPVAPLEAMAMEIPVVATNVPGIRDVVNAGETGLLAAVDDTGPAELVAAVRRLVEDPEYRRCLGIAARRKVISEFSIERMQRELEALYEEVLARRSA